MILLRWIVLVIAAGIGGVAVYFMTHGCPGTSLLLVLMVLVLGSLDVLMSTSLTSRSSAGKAYGIPYYLEWDGHRHYFSADVYGYCATAPCEREIKEVVFRRLTQAVARRAIDKMIGRLQ